MMLIIHGFPPTTKYADVKDLIREMCHIDINNFILDNLLPEDNGKKVRIGLSDETDGYRVLKCLNGFRMSGAHVLRVESVKALKPEYQRPVFQDPPRNIDYPGNQSYRDQSNYHDHRPSGPNGPNQGPIDSRHGPNSGLMDSRHGPNRGPMDSRQGQIDNRYSGSGSIDSRGPNYPNHGPMDSRYSHGPLDVRPDSHGHGGSMDTRPGFQNQLDRSGPHGPNDSRYPDDRMGHQFQNRFSKPDQVHMDRPDMSQNQGNISFGSNEPMRSQSWQPNVPQNNNQWSGNQGGPPMQQNAYNVQQQNVNPGFDLQTPIQQETQYGQGRPPQDQSYGYPRKNLPVPEMITIMKDNFQGPTQYNPASLTPSQGQIQPQPWASQAPQQKPYEKTFDKRPDIKPIPERDNRRYSPTRDTRSPPRDIRGFNDGKGGPNRRPSPLARHAMTSGRDVSASGLKNSPTTSGRRISPSGRRISPSGRRISPFGRRISPSGRGISPSGRRVSPPGRRISPTERRVSPSGRRVSPPGRRISPSGPGRRISPSGPGRRISPSGPGRKISPSGPGRRISPSSPGRRISPSGPERRISPSGPGRRISPSDPGRRTLPGRRISPSGRRISPGRRMSPSGRRISPSDRRLSPKRRTSPGRRKSPGENISAESHISSSGRRILPGRHVSPGSRISPGRHLSPGRLTRDEQRRSSPSMMSYNYREGDRRVNVRSDLHRFSPKRDSPNRRSPARPRFSPARHEDKPTDKYDDGKAKTIRAAYESTGPGAQTQYSGGYRPSLHENVQYPIGITHWQKDKYASSKAEEEIRDMPRMGGDSKILSRSPGRSRSPRDRFRRHSPSPRSPRRSWALEKRRSPEEMTAPPPPVWPGQEQEKPRTRFDESQKKSVWERPDDLRPDDRRPSDHRSEPVEFKEKFTRARWEEARDSRNYHTDEIKPRDERHPDRRESPREDKPRLTEIDKDFQDIYKRALEFRKKAEELRKSGEKKREDYHSDRHDNKYTKEDSPGRTKLEAFKRKLDRKANDSSNQFERRFLTPEVKAKRQKAIDEISEKILSRHNFRGEQRRRILEELKLALAKTLNDMFGVEDVSYIELVIKYRARYVGPDEDKILMDVLSSLPSHYQAGLKRKNEESGNVPAKTKRRSSPPAPTQEVSRPKLFDSVRWDMHIQPPKMADMSTITVGINRPQNTTPVKPPVMPAYQDIPQTQLYPSTFQQMQVNPAHMQVDPAQTQVNPAQTQVNPAQMQINPGQMQINPGQMQIASAQMQGTPSQMQQFQATLQMQNLHSSPYQMMPDLHQAQLIYGDMEAQYLHPMQIEPQKSDTEGNLLYLCQDDFEPFATHQADCLKKFLINQMIRVTEANEGWAPDFTLRGLNNAYRYEVSTSDPKSRDWLLNLDFSDFEYFNVLVYTKEELWYERAAIWLPGHSKFRSIEPMQKLVLQNRHLEGVNIGKWKFVKKVVTVKGIRLYVDMPPSAARALERYKMMLSYELSKVTVILKTVAVDKDTFDAGLKQTSVKDPGEMKAAVMSSPMPTLASKEPGVVKISLNGVKTLEIETARKIKEIVVYHLFKYLQNEDGSSGKTDFLKYGFCQPDSLGIVPENEQSKRWLLSRHFGKLRRKTVVVVGSEDMNTKFFKMYAYIAGEHTINRALVFERLKQSNLSVKGMHFNLWKPMSVTSDRKQGSNKVILELEMDLDSIETLSKMNYALDYVGDRGTFTTTVNFKSDYTYHKLEEKIRKCKAEQQDSYDVANMDLDSGSEKKRDAHSSSSVISRAPALYSKHRPPAKRSAPVEKSTAKKIKTDDIREKNNPLDKYKKILVTAAGPQQTDYELSPLMTNIVENELNLLMNKIYESFPKEITNEAEKFVYNKYKGHVGAALRNTIGLNITKRLLNVHDRLLVKLTFSNTPSGKELDKFINTYKLTNFKKIPHLGHTYVADLKSYNDLDNLCSVKNLHCGHVEITAKPCIPFMKCPQNLKTNFRSTFIQTEQKQTDAQSEKILESENKVKQEKTEYETEVTTKDDNKTKNSKTDKVKATESKQSNVKPKPHEVTKATTQNKSQETPKVTQKSQASNKVTESTKVSNTHAKTQEDAKETQAKPEADPKVKTTPINTKVSAKAKTTIIKTEDATNMKTTAIKSEKTTPTKTEATSKAKTTPEVTASTIKTEETNPKTAAPKTTATNIETTTTKTEESPKAKSSETIKVTTTATKTDTTKAKITPTKAESAPNSTTPAKIELKISKPQDTPKTNNTKPNTQENKVKTQNELNKSTTQTKTQDVKKPTTTKYKEGTQPKPQTKPEHTTKTNTQTAKTTFTKKEVNKNKEVKKVPERKKKESDFDELDDQDILAMLSGGIILDECSGSDDD